MSGVARAVFLASILTISLISTGAQFSEIEFSSDVMRGRYFSDEASNSSMSNENNSTDSDGDLVPDELDTQPNNPLIGHVTHGKRFSHEYFIGTDYDYGQFQWDDWEGAIALSLSSDTYCDYTPDNHVFRDNSNGNIVLNCMNHYFDNPQNVENWSDWTWLTKDIPAISNITGDFNGDGFTDYIDSSCVLWKGLDETETNYLESISIDISPCSIPSLIQIADMDNDGYDDIVLAHPRDGTPGFTRPFIEIYYFSEFGIDETNRFTIYLGGPEDLVILGLYVFDEENDGDLDIFFHAGGRFPPLHVVISNPDTNDMDSDGILNEVDDFPNDSSEWKDTDGDGIGDNADIFPTNSSEWKDTDGDGVGDNKDEFPLDQDEWEDSDGDGIGDNSDEYPNDSSRWKDTDNDGIDDNIDTDIDGDGIPNSIEDPSSGLSVFSFLLVISLLVIISNDFKS